jgi:methionyl-tRNA formyltransferase
MAYVVALVPQRILDVPALGTIQYHPSLLPRHRGPSSINWPIIQGETKTGLSIFWPDEGLDTGPILLQKEVEIGPDDTLGSVYFDRLFPLGVKAMIEAVDRVRAGRAPRIAQDEANATYEGWCTKEVAQIDWTLPVDRVYDLIRGCNPQPGAWTTRDGRPLEIFDAAKREGTGGEPGEVTAVDGESFAVAARGGAIRVLRARPEGGEKRGAGEIARTVGIERGTRLG